MLIQKLAIALTASVLFLGCTSQSPQTQSSPTPSPSESTQPIYTNTLKGAIEELQMLQTKIKSGINAITYLDLISNTAPIVQRASGEAKAVAAMKSAFEGHQLALKFWQCDQVNGYDELHQCRGKVLSRIFAKYPDIAAQTKATAKGKDLATISVGLEKEAILEKIWEKTNADTQVARKAISPATTQKERQP